MLLISFAVTLAPSHARPHPIPPSPSLVPGPQVDRPAIGDALLHRRLDFLPDLFAVLSGDPAGPSAVDRIRRMAALPPVETRLSPEEALASARPLASGGLVSVTWPGESEPKWKIAFARPGGTADVSVDDRSAAATPPKAPRPETTARLIRSIHDGSGMGTPWQMVIFIGGLIPALLAVPGILMWLHIRRGRARAGVAG